MRLTPNRLMQALRVGGIGAGVAAVGALAGPFRYEDLGLPFPDTVAHAILFYGVTLAMLTSLPRSRASEVALGAVALGAASEVAQFLVGREMSLHDLAGDTFGVLAAYAPVAVTRLRELARTHPHQTFAEIRAQDRRRAPAGETRQRPSSSPIL